MSPFRRLLISSSTPSSLSPSRFFAATSLLSFKSSSQRHFSSPSPRGYDMELDFDESIQQINELHSGLKVIKTAAVRGLEFNQPENGNYLTLSLLNNLQNKLHLLQGNWTANAIFIGSKSIDFFSAGLHHEDIQSDGISLFQKVQDIAEMIEYYPEKNLLSLYAGYLTGTPFAMLLSSTYRLGTSTTLLSIDEPVKGQIPIGGLAYKFCQLSPRYGKLIARYLCCSGALVDAETLFELGILTNVTGQKPYLGLQYLETLPINDTQAVQPPQGEPAYLPDMVEDMHLEEEMDDLSQYDVWNRFLRVPLQIPNLEPKLGEGHLKRIFHDVEYCFSAPTVDETLTRLQSIQHPFARYTLENMIKCDPMALESFFALTDFANAKRIEIESLEEFGESREHILSKQRIGFLESLAKEIKVTEMLLERQKQAKATGKGWILSNIPKKSEFDLSPYESINNSSEESEGDLGNKKTFKEITEDENRQKEEQKSRDEELEVGVRHLRAALASLPQEFLSEIKLPPK